MVRYSKRRILERELDERNDNETVRLLNVLNVMIFELDPLKQEEQLRWFDTSAVFDFFKAQDEFSWLESKSWLTRNLKKLDVYAKNLKTVGKATRVYIVDVAKLGDYSCRYLPPTDESVTVTESVTSEFLEYEPK